MFFCITIFNS